MATSRSMQVFRDACDALAGELTPHGFKYLKSKREMLRHGRLFEHSVTFGTSRSINSLPGHVHLEVRASASSASLGEYRAKAGIELPTNEEFLFSTPIENLFRPAPPYIRYDVGDPGTRDAVLARVGEVLCTEVLRAFDLVESPPDLRAAVDSAAIQCLGEGDIRDYFACFASVRPQG